MLLGDFAEWSKFSDAGIGKHDIDSSLGRNGFVETIEVGQFRNVSLNASNIAANCFQGLVKLLLATTRDEDVGALFYKELRCSQPYPGRASSNHCYFALKLLRPAHRQSSSVSVALGSTRDGRNARRSAEIASACPPFVRISATRDSASCVERP